MNRVLIEAVSPNGNVMASAETDGHCVYFYLHGAPETEFGVRSCWVRNVDPAPANLDVEAMGRGEAPRLPAGFCRHIQGAEPLAPDRLRIVWFEFQSLRRSATWQFTMAAPPSTEGCECRALGGCIKTVNPWLENRGRVSVRKQSAEERI